jgi:hypothetical protein
MITNKLLLIFIIYICVSLKLASANSVIECEKIPLVHKVLRTSCVSSYLEINDYSLGYSFPNELYDFLYEDQIKDITGMFIGVGSFRVWQRSAYSSAQLVVFIDENPFITSLNYHISQLISKSNTRSEFLVNLFNLRQEDAEIFRNLSEPRGTLKIHREIMSRMEKSTINKNLGVFSEENILLKLANHFSSYLSQLHNHPSAKISNMFLSDAAFLDLKFQHSTKSHIFINSKIQNYELMYQLVALFKDNFSSIPFENLKHAMDISNIPDWMPMSNAESNNDRALVAKIIKELGASNSKLLYTLASLKPNEPLRPMLESTAEDRMDFFYYLADGPEAMRALSAKKGTDRISTKALGKNVCDMSLNQRIFKTE